MKTVDDAIRVKNHIINMLELVDIERENKELMTRLVTFVLVDRGFSVIETIGELNDL
jgi:NADH dehydrogenase